MKLVALASVVPIAEALHVARLEAGLERGRLELLQLVEERGVAAERGGRLELVVAVLGEGGAEEGEAAVEEVRLAERDGGAVEHGRVRHERADAGVGEERGRERPRAAEEVAVGPLRLPRGPGLGEVAALGRDDARIALAHAEADDDGRVLGLLLRHVGQRDLEQVQPEHLALPLDQLARREPVADAERQLAPHDGGAHRLGPLDLDLADPAARAGSDPDHHVGPVAEGIHLRDGDDVGEGVALVANPAERLVLELEQGEVVEPGAPLERDLVAEGPPVITQRRREEADGGLVVGPDEDEAVEQERRPLLDGVDEAYRVPRGVQPDEPVHLGGEEAVPMVEPLQPHDILLHLDGREQVGAHVGDEGDEREPLSQPYRSKKPGLLREGDLLLQQRGLERLRPGELEVD